MVTTFLINLLQLCTSQGTTAEVKSPLLLSRSPCLSIRQTTRVLTLHPKVIQGSRLLVMSPVRSLSLRMKGSVLSPLSHMECTLGFSTLHCPEGPSVYLMCTHRQKIIIVRAIHTHQMRYHEELLTYRTDAPVTYRGEPSLTHRGMTYWDGSLSQSQSQHQEYPRSYQNGPYDGVGVPQYTYKMPPGNYRGIAQR